MIVPEPANEVVKVIEFPPATATIPEAILACPTLVDATDTIWVFPTESIALKVAISGSPLEVDGI